MSRAVEENQAFYGTPRRIARTTGDSFPHRGTASPSSCAELSRDKSSPWVDLGFGNGAMLPRSVAGSRTRGAPGVDLSAKQIAQNTKLKRVYAELVLENAAIKDVLSRKR